MENLILVNDHLDAQFFHIRLFQISMFRALILTIRRINCITMTSGTSLCVRDRLVCRFGWNCSSTQTYIPDGHLHRVTYTRCRTDTINSPDDEHVSAQNMLRFGINIYEKRIVCQVGHLQELYRDVRSTKHKILENLNSHISYTKGTPLHPWKFYM